MPFYVEGRRYEIWSIDTNVVSEMLKRPDEALRAALLKTLESMAVLGFSVWTLFELRRHSGVFDSFVSYFGTLPFVILDSPVNIFAAELDAYPDPSDIRPVVYSFNPFQDGPEASLDHVFGVIFGHPTVQEAERRWATDWKRDGLAAVVDLKKNFPPRGKNYNSRDAREFVRRVVPQHMAKHRPDIHDRAISNAGKVEVDAFPSLKMTLYTTFFRIYVDGRAAEEQDVFDIFISAATPYVDRVVTEVFQAEIYRKVGRFDRMLDNVEVGTMATLRQWIADAP